MAKININFNNTVYSIENSLLSSATSELKTHLSAVMNGEGATINLDGDVYNIDSVKLSTATNDLVSHLETISGSGSKVAIGGVEYSVDSSKIRDAISGLEAAFGILDKERLEGDGAEYYTLAPTPLSFRSDAPLNELQDIQINGVTVSPSNYTLEEGSTIVTFPIEYLKTLETGNYEVTIVSESKSVNGSFSVAAPELNEYGFYYNQPYIGYVNYYDTNWVFLFHEDGTMDFMIVGNNADQICTWEIDGNNLTVNSSSGTFTGTVSETGIYCNEVATNFILGNESIVADKDYIYIYNDELSGYEVSVIDKTQSVYGIIRTRINGIPTVKIANKAFYKCESLTNILYIPNDIISIGDDAFFECRKLSSIDIPDSVTNIGNNAFYCCEKLTDVSFSSGLKSIGYGAFQNCGISWVNIPNSVTNIGDRAFLSCKELTHLYILSNVMTSIGDSVFQNCGLTQVVLPQGITSIGDNAFRYCDSLTDINIPDGVTSIGRYAFESCTSLSGIHIPDSVTSIGDYAFKNCNLKNIYISNNITTIGISMFEGSDINSLIIPDGVISVGDYAFKDCIRLISVTIPDSVMSMGYRAFYGCSLLTSIIYEGSIEQWNQIQLDSNWTDCISKVQCTDGTIEI